MHTCFLMQKTQDSSNCSNKGGVHEEPRRVVINTADDDIQVHYICDLVWADKIADSQMNGRHFEKKYMNTTEVQVF